MEPQQLILQCYAEQDGDVWVAVCLNFNLAAQGDSFEETKAKLEAMIVEYVNDALVGEDRAYSAQLLTRNAPFSIWMRYQFIRLKIWSRRTRDHILRERIFNETMPLRPA